MEIVEIKSEKLNDKYYKIKHTSGLTIYVSPKEGYKSAYAIFGTHFGSVNSHFITMVKKLLYLTELHTILSISFLRARTAMPSQSMQRQVLTLTLIPHLIQLAICSLAQISLMKALEFCLISFVTLISLRKQLLRNKALLVRKLRCMTIVRTGEL